MHLWIAGWCRVTKFYFCVCTEKGSNYQISLCPWENETWRAGATPGWWGSTKTRSWAKITPSTIFFFVSHLLICIHTVWHLCFLFCCFLCRMPLWSSLMALLCLGPCLKMIQKHKHCTVHQEWILWFKDIFYHPGFLHACIVIIVIVQAKPIQFLDLALTFEHQMGELCTQLFERGLAEHKRRETEVKTFFSCQEKAVTDCQEKASQMLAKFNHEHKEASREQSPFPCAQWFTWIQWLGMRWYLVFSPLKRTEELQQLSDPEVRKVKIDHCNDEINRLCKNLMTLEFQLVSEMEVSVC